ncbi:ABC transporter ATP-binding protein [Sediminispirochaeta bajacaliforniensis]|uniref:ABC transporter ATP-binding protein n=1 Tax=Sediminispirochaeta bajacaliforniensis TaxID=148 RepID=UPI0003805706|nr:ABC transporter ATP-binding protein [Sediminispirochaeta bajacaliforniensis]
MLVTENLTFAYTPAVPVLRGITMTALPGKITALIGPNAAGKSTLLKCLSHMEGATGIVRWDDCVKNRKNRARWHRLIGYLPQYHDMRTRMTAFEFVLLGRLDDLSWRLGDEDLDQVMSILNKLGIAHLATRYVDELSGGQQQMTSLAQTLVGSPRVLLLDEPTNSLDIKNELQMLDRITFFTKEHNIATVMTIHSLSQAARCADHVVLLHEGHIEASGAPEDILNPELIRNVYGVETRIIRDGRDYAVIPRSIAQL